MNIAPLSSSGKNPEGVILNITNINKIIPRSVKSVFLGEFTKYFTTPKYLSLTPLNQSSNFCINSKSVFSSPDFNIIEQSAGDKVNATTVDKPTDVAIQTANCRYI